MDAKLLAYAMLGGAIGTGARYLLSGWFTKSDFPTGILVVNAVGCFLIGLLMFGGIAGGWLQPGARVFLAIGVLGGFTTMSSFTYDTMALAEQAEYLRASANVGFTLVVCFVGTLLGRMVGLAMWSGGN